MRCYRNRISRELARLGLKVCAHLTIKNTIVRQPRQDSWVTRCIAKHTLYRNAWFTGALVLAVHVRVYARVGVYVHVHVYAY